MRAKLHGGALSIMAISMTWRLYKRKHMDKKLTPNPASAEGKSPIWKLKQLSRMVWSKRLCRMCDTRCAVNVHLKDGVIADITPFDGHPVNRGKICPRGSAAIDQFYHIDRITQPLKKLADGTFIKISRRQALDEIAAKIDALKHSHGARSIGVWKGEGLGFHQQEDYIRRFVHALRFAQLFFQ